jgi:hypothetical protein
VSVTKWATYAFLKTVFILRRPFVAPTVGRDLNECSPFDYLTENRAIQSSDTDDELYSGASDIGGHWPRVVRTSVRGMGIDVSDI